MKMVRANKLLSRIRSDWWYNSSMRKRKRPTASATIGCCGWGEAQARYFEHFAAIELQAPFYQMPSASLAAKWRAAAPAGFQFYLKAWQLITHTPASPTYRRLKEPVSASERELFGSFRPTEQVWLAWERTQEIARVLEAAVILFQCPASFDPAPHHVRNLRAFFSQIERGSARLAWEPRGHWPDPLVRELCVEFDLLHCVDPFKARSVYGDPLYWRLHGRNGYRYTYTDADLTELRNQITEAQSPGIVLFNNYTMRDNALRFQAMLA